MDKRILSLLAAALSLVTLSLNAADTVTNGQAVARSRLVQPLTSVTDVSVALAPAATNITYAWELWNLGTNAISITNGIAGTNVILGASEGVGLRAVESNAWRIIFDRTTIGDILPLTASDLIISDTNRWEDLRVSPNGVNPVGVADAASLVINSGPSADQLALQFSEAAVNVAAVDYQMPHSWVSNTIVYPHIHFAPTTTGTGGVVFVSRVSWANIGDVFPASTITTNTYQITTNSQWTHMLWAIPSGGVNGSNKWYSSVLNWRFERLGNHTDDTYGGAIDLYSADLHYRWRGAPVVYEP